MNELQKLIDAFEEMTSALCDAIKESKSEKRYVIYKNEKCELFGKTDGGYTLNTGGIAFCIIMPNGSVKNVQDSECVFV